MKDVIIIGGSFAGLSAAMSLARSMRDILIIDSGNPCNKQTPHAHNILTHDGHTPNDITALSKIDVLKYPTTAFKNDLVVHIEKNETGFHIVTKQGITYTSRKILFATGVTDQVPQIPGFAECWGKSVIHCPYCHGYEFRNKRTGVLATSDAAFEMTKMVYHWSKDLYVLTNGPAQFEKEQTEKLEALRIPVIEKQIKLVHKIDGHLQSVVFADNSVLDLDALYARPPFIQQSELPAQIGCQFNNNLIKVDEMQRTTIPGIYAAGDNSSMLRSLAMAIAAGSKAGAVINNELINDDFNPQTLLQGKGA